jgi:uracil-DNA glycosylase
MNELESLYTNCAPDSCSGCSILSQKKPFYANLDFDELKCADVLFVSDSYNYRYGETQAFSAKELNLISQATSQYSNYSQEYIPSIRCPSVKEADISASDMKLCRSYLEESINRVKPKLVFACGNLAMRMLIKKSGINDKRGESYSSKNEEGHEYIVVPIYHPLYAIREPEKVTLFYADIKRACDKFLLGKTVNLDLNYSVIRDVKDLYSYDWLKDTDSTLSVDLECEGLNFLSDRILTIGICWGDKSLVIPMFHKEHVWSSLQLGAIEFFLESIFSNPNNDKIFHNAKFDLKFLMSFGIKEFRRVKCTKLNYHVTENENDPKSLRDLVKKYYPEYLEVL